MQPSKKYTSHVLEICDNGDAILELPPDLLADMGWGEGTILNIDEKDGNIVITEAKK
jgi:hypothetical protein